MAESKTPNKNAQQLITEHLDIWTTAIEQKSSSGRGSSKKFSLHGIKKLRELILELAVRGKLVPQDPNDEPASVLLARIAAEKAQLVKDKKIKKPKALPEINEDEKPFELPEGWEWARLGEIAKKLTDGSHNPSRNNGEGYPMLSGQNVNYGKIDFVNPSRYVDQENYDKEHSRTLVQENDVLLTIVGSIGRSAVVPPMAPKFVLQRSVAVISTDLIPEFICNQFISPICMRYFDKHAKGTAQKGIYLGKLSLMLLVIPPLDEQQRIVAKVDELMSLCDELEAQTENSITAHQTLVEVLLEALLKAPEQGTTPEQTAEQFQQNWQRLSEHFDTLFTTTASIDTLKQTILQLAVIGKLVPQNPNDEPAAKLLERIAAEKAQLIKDKKIKKQKPLPEITDEEKPFELPNGWEWVRFGDMYLLEYGNNLPQPKRSNTGEFSVYGSNGVVGTHNEASIQGQCIVVGRKGSAGALNLCSEKGCWVTDVAYSISPPIGIDIDFCFYQLHTLGLDSLGKGIKPGLNRNEANILLVAVPPSEEQHGIVAKVNELMAFCDQLKARLTDAQTTKLHLTDAIVEQAL
ncbi:restriction endonuclease subunit S [Pseudoalteromonas sp. Xi13]|uniref:restriction endonuclease subunit S n=1 Tax=Pseudoalteromonas sp. Xi13 TaxID=2490635 RepID=UPI000F76240D|nr:restriction endonuclease subunit S [Pseudoalteromonas sp. Xi13]AZN33310.1 restriction endonuclease subunit S [Pseudoalteromonas sp. Xi13]